MTTAAPFTKRSAGGATALEAAAVRKAFRRLVPLCMTIYVLSYIDRINVGFAALTMNAELALTATTFGLAGTAFYFAYSICEIPSNLGLARFGARIWISRIMITWGLATIATMFAVGPRSLAGLRALVGAAEAGMLPGIMFYLTLWFPDSHRGRANSLFFMSLPLALLIGAPLSGAVLQMDGVAGLSGWRWLFLLEGLPSVLGGVLIYRLLPNGPADARWLRQDEREAILSQLERDRAPAAAEPRERQWGDVLSTAVIVLGIVYFCLLNTTATFTVWTPLIVKDVLGGSKDDLLVSLVSAVPPLVALCAMGFWTAHSDRTRERFWHVVTALLVAALGWAVVASSTAPAAKLAGLAACFVGAYSTLPLFWANASQLIAPRSRAVGIAFVSTVGTFSAIIGPTITGFLRDQTHSFTAGAWFAAGLLVVAAGLMMAVRRRGPGPTSRELAASQS